MKFSCKTQDLLQALQLGSRAISGQQALPILQNILIDVAGERCTVSSTDLELSIITTFPAQVEHEGSLTIPAKAILAFAQYNTDTEVLLESMEGTQLHCTSRHGKTLIAGEAATEYPTISAVEKTATLRLEATPLLRALNLVTFSCAKTTLRPVLAGVSVRRESAHLVFVATDSYRLSEYRLPVEEGAEMSCIIPVKVLEELKMVLGGLKKSGDDIEREKKEKKEIDAPNVQVALSQQQIEFSVGGTRLISRLIDGKFPDYRQIIPASAPTTIAIPVSELLTNVKRMHYFAKEVNNTLTFSVGSGDLKIHTPATQLGRDEATIQAEVTGKETKVALSSTYLLDFLSHINADTLRIEMVDSMYPAIFKIPETDGFLHLIMPLRMQEG